ncbi:MFS transporter [Pseudomonas sp. JS3066]|jgi:MFS family permease|uniref:MFS transporter n=1 Tax=unclassified Pseudomonas TaxID=196821 RepID=UPI000EAA8D36|nr:MULTISPECIES: MFS transporter [unclassified Pseudomonas]AYF86368.1 MFS transporter [Pseudomonas sp. DY-1]MRK23700.1 MFS transporter [Pseudomonas sp. JG-B]WVK96177.1 MFS transporter [Pseudomonas sp. JS3066]
MNRDNTAFRPASAWTIAVLLAFMMLVNFLDKVVIGLVAVPMTEELDLTPTEFGLIGGALHWLFAVSAVVGGFLANRRPTRTLLLGMGLFWALIQLPMLFASSLWMIVACRVLLGIGEGPASPVATHALYKWFPDDRRSLPVALLHSGSAMGLLVAGAMIPWISLHYGWRTNFVVLAAIGVVWCALWLLLGREGTLDNLRAGQVTPDTHRVPYRRLLTDGSVLGNYACHFAANWSLALTLTWVPSYLEVGLGIDPLNTGRMFVLFVVVTTPLSLFMAWLSQRLLHRGVPSRLARGAFVSGCLIVAGLFSASLILQELSVTTRIITLTLSGGLALVMYSVGPAMLAEFTPSSQRGGILAIGNAVASLAGLSAPVVTGLLVHGAGAGHPQGYAQGFLVCGGVLIMAGLIGLVTMNPQRSRERLAQDDSPALCSRA